MAGEVEMTEEGKSEKITDKKNSDHLLFERIRIDVISLWNERTGTVTNSEVVNLNFVGIISRLTKVA